MSEQVTERPVCAGCDGEIKDDYLIFDVPASLTFSEVEFYIFGKSQFCTECIAKIEAYDGVEYQK